MNIINVFLAFKDVRHHVGQLMLSERLGRYVFNYHRSFLGTALEISPFNLPLTSDTYVSENNEGLYSLPGVFADALPDEWGKKIQDAEFEKLGLFEVTSLERLSFVGRHGLGALQFEPENNFDTGKMAVTLSELRKATQRILEGSIEDVTHELLQMGGSAGGARPKFMVDLDSLSLSRITYSYGEPLEHMIPTIIKVSGKDNDHWQRIEYCYFKMAEQSGIDVPFTWLLEENEAPRVHFAIERFDRNKQGERFHTHTFAGLLGVDFRDARLDYTQLMRTTATLTRNHHYLIELFKRMVFNYLGCNKDDHGKNFSFSMDSTGEWRLSPAYDLSFSSGDHGLHAMAVNGKRRNLTKMDLRQVADDYDIKNWQGIIEKGCEALLQWHDLAIENGVPAKHISLIAERIKENIRRIEKN